MKNNKIIKHGHLIFYLVFMTFFSAILTAQNKETDEYEVLILPSNHWDRLWQMPFEVHRLRMVNMVDHLMEIMESKPGFKYFTFDGQTSLIDDYLDIRAENADRIKKLIQEGRILIGPWYTQPNVFMVSGEAIIRNLYFGIVKGNEYGKVMKYCYLPDAFGLNSQLPQILNGFDIQDVFFWRGIPKSYEGIFKWYGSDGSYCYAYNSRYSEGNHIIDELPFGEDKKTNNKFLEQFESYFRKRKEVLETPFIPIVNGRDMQWATDDLPEKVEFLNKHYDDVQIKVSNFPEVNRKMVEYYYNNKLEMKTYTGEIREYTGTGPILTASQSTRTDLKIASRNAETLLEKYAEPASSFFWLSGFKYFGAELNQGWNYLIDNQHHDNTGGASHDNDYHAVMSDLQLVEEIGTEVTRKSTVVMAKQILEDYEIKDKEFGFVVFNSLAWKRSGTVDLVLNIPESANIRTPAIVDAEGGNEYLMYPDKIEPNNVYMGPKAKRYRVSLPLNDLPAFGYKTFKVIDKKHNPRVWQFYPESSLKTGVYKAENEYLKMKINEDGTLNIYDKRTGYTFKNVHYFRDDGEAGSGFEGRRPIGDEVITTLQYPARVSLLYDNPYKITYRIEWNIEIPKEIDKDYERRRINEQVDYKIISHVSLKKGKPRIDIETMVNNTAKDHRLRVCFPTYLNTSYSRAEQPFDVVKRSIPNSPDQFENQENYWCPVDGSHPMLSFVDISDGEKGLMVSSDLALYEVTPDSSKTLEIDLIRSLDRIHTGSIGRKLDVRIPEAQMMGKYKFQYSIIPHPGNWEEGINEAYEFQFPPHIANPSGIGKELTYLKSKRKLKDKMPLSYSFINLSNKNIMISAIKKHEKKNALIIRLYNPSDKRQKGTLDVNPLNFVIKDVKMVNMMEEPVQTTSMNIDYDNDGVSINVEPKKIINLMFEMGGLN